MTPARAREFAADLYHVPSAAAPLLVLACSEPASELRSRAAAALRCLDRDEPCPAPIEPVDVAVAAWARCLAVLLRTAGRATRVRLAPLLAAVAVEATRLDRAREAA